VLLLRLFVCRFGLQYQFITSSEIMPGVGTGGPCFERFLFAFLHFCLIIIGEDALKIRFGFELFFFFLWPVCRFDYYV
jgi:hypothetical protein